MRRVTWQVARKKMYDASGIDHPENWMWSKKQGVYYPSLEVVHTRTVNEILVRKIQGIDCTEEESAEIKGYIREQKYNVPYEIQYHFMLELVEVLEEDNVQPIFVNTEAEDETKPYRKRYGLLTLMTDYEGTTCTTYEQAMRRAVDVFYADTKEEILAQMIEEFNTEELSEMHKVFLVDRKEQTILLSPKN